MVGGLEEAKDEAARGLMTVPVAAAAACFGGTLVNLPKSG
jgi:hypothetical protein